MITMTSGSTLSLWEEIKWNREKSSDSVNRSDANMCDAPFNERSVAYLGIFLDGKIELEALKIHI